MTPRALLWDFGDTLADERWMQAPMVGVPRWPAVWRSRMGDGKLARRWDLGQITSAEVAAELGRDLGVPADTVLAHMRACCRNIAFFPGVMDIVDRCPLPQAIVTINPDIFSEVVAPAYRLAERFAAIVTSWEAGSGSKADLCDIALARLGGDLTRVAIAGLRIRVNAPGPVGWRRDSWCSSRRFSCGA